MKTNFKGNFLRHLKDQHGGDKSVSTVSENSHGSAPSDVREVPCHICKELVLLGDDYRCHLNIAHGILDDTVDVNKYELRSIPDTVGAEVTCYICNEFVLSGDDYQSHLLCVHEVQ